MKFLVLLLKRFSQKINFPTVTEVRLHPIYIYMIIINLKKKRAYRLFNYSYALAVADAVVVFPKTK